MTSEALTRRLALHPQVALRPERFGALAYHYGTRRLVFLKHPDLVAVVRALGDHDGIDAALDACSIVEHQRPALVDAVVALAESGMLVHRDESPGDMTSLVAQ